MKITDDVEIPNALTVVGGILFVLFMAYLLCVNHISVNEMGGWYDAANGAIWTNEHPGWYVTPPWPWVEEVTVDLKPNKICLESSTARLVNCKLVRFRKEGFQDYIKLQGFDSPSDNVLLGYAYSGRQFSFLQILEEPDKDPLAPDVSTPSVGK